MPDDGGSVTPDDGGSDTPTNGGSNMPNDVIMAPRDVIDPKDATPIPATVTSSLRAPSELPESSQRAC